MSEPSEICSGDGDFCDSVSSECECGSCPEVLVGEELVLQTLEELEQIHGGQRDKYSQPTTALKCRFPYQMGDFWQVQSQLIGVSRLNFTNFTKRPDPMATPVKSLQLFILISICSFKNRISFAPNEIEKVFPLLITYLDGFLPVYQTYACEVIEFCFQRNLIKLNCKLNELLTDRIIWIARYGENRVKIKLLDLIDSYVGNCNNIYALIRLLPILNSYLTCGNTAVKRSVLRILNNFPEKNLIKDYYRNKGIVFYVNQLVMFPDETIAKESLIFLNQYTKSLRELVHLICLIDFKTLMSHLNSHNVEIRKQTLIMYKKLGRLSETHLQYFLDNRVVESIINEALKNLEETLLTAFETLEILVYSTNENQLKLFFKYPFVRLIKNYLTTHSDNVREINLNITQCIFRKLLEDPVSRIHEVENIRDVSGRLVYSPEPEPTEPPFFEEKNIPFTVEENILSYVLNIKNFKHLLNFRLVSKSAKQSVDYFLEKNRVIALRNCSGIGPKISLNALVQAFDRLKGIDTVILGDSFVSRNILNIIKENTKENLAALVMITCSGLIYRDWALIGLSFKNLLYLDISGTKLNELSLSLIIDYLEQLEILKGNHIGEEFTGKCFQLISARIKRITIDISGINHDAFIQYLSEADTPILDYLCIRINQFKLVNWDSIFWDRIAKSLTKFKLIVLDTSEGNLSKIDKFIPDKLIALSIVEIDDSIKYRSIIKTRSILGIINKQRNLKALSIKSKKNGFSIDPTFFSKLCSYCSKLEEFELRNLSTEIPEQIPYFRITIKHSLIHLDKLRLISIQNLDSSVNNNIAEILLSKIIKKHPKVEEVRLHRSEYEQEMYKALCQKAKTYRYSQFRLKIIGSEINTENSPKNLFVTKKWDQFVKSIEIRRKFKIDPRYYIDL